MPKVVPELVEDGQLPAYTWPGGYPVYYLHATQGDCEVLCPECAQEVWESGEQLCWENNWEDLDLYCDACNRRIKAAYGEREDEEKEG